MNIQQAMASFTRRWDRLERSMGTKGGLVIDFDMCPRDLSPVAPGLARSDESDPSAFDSRHAALAALDLLRDRLQQADEPVHNRTFLRAHFRASDAYLRALMGQRAPFADYLQDTMGMPPQPADPDRLASQLDALRSRLSARGIPWGPDGYDAMRAQLGRATLDGFEAELRQHAQRLVAMVRSRLPAAPQPDYRIQVVSEDAYWTNWIDGSVEEGVTLKVNAHPRATYTKTSPLQLAAHEIAGHAVHVGCLRNSPTVDPAALSLTVHGCEAYQMEGLAQAMIHLLLGDDMPDEIALLEAYRDYSGDVLNTAQLRVEAGEPIDQVCAQTIAACPLSKPLTIRSSLRDRSLSPLHRAYIYVYPPSRRAFLRALTLPRSAQDAFLSAAMTGLWTPTQIEALLDGQDPAVVRST